MFYPPRNTSYFKGLEQVLFGTLHTLTLRAVVPLPPFQADAVALLVAGVVAQRVVPRPAVLGATVPKVVLVTEDVVGVAQLALLAEVHVLGPVLADGQPPPGRQAAHEVVLVVWGRGIFKTNLHHPPSARILRASDGEDCTPVRVVYLVLKFQ